MCIRDRTRRAYADVLYNAVLEGDIPLHQALATVQHGILHRGTKKTENMTVFKEWRDLEGRLMEADAKRRKEKEGVEEAAILSRIEAFKTIENPTIETRAAFIRKLRNDFRGVSIPDEGYNIVYGYKDDDTMKQILARKEAANGGYILSLIHI